MTYPSGKIILEEKTMNVTLTLNEITVGQAQQVLDLVKSEKEAEPDRQTPAQSEPVKYEEINPVKTVEAEYKVEDIRKALAELARTKGKDEAKKVLTKFGASKVTELESACFADVMKAVEEVS